MATYDLALIRLVDLGTPVGPYAPLSAEKLELFHKQLAGGGGPLVF